MPTRRRVRTHTPDLTVNYITGSFSVGGVGNVAWGADFGESTGTDGTTFRVGATPGLIELKAAGGVGTILLVEMNKAGLSGGVGVTASTLLPSINLSGTVSTNAAVAMNFLLMSGTTSLTASANMPSLLLSGTVSLQALIEGEALGVPFWQSVQTTGSTATATSLSVAKPLNVGSDNEILLAFVGASNSNPVSAPAITTPSGWTLVRTDTQTILGGATRNNTCAIYYRVTDGTEPSVLTWSITSFDNGTLEVHHIVGADASSVVDVSGASTLLSTDLQPDPSAPSVTTTVINTLVFFHLFHDHALLSNTHTVAATHDERTDFESINGITTSTYSSDTASKAYASTGATGALQFNCTETVSTDAITQTVAIKPGTVVL